MIDYGTVTEDWTGRTVYVVGGGPSLSGFDFSTIRGYPSVGANDAGMLADTDVLITIDKNYFRHRCEDMQRRALSGKRVYAGLSPAPVNQHFPQEITYLKHDRGEGVSEGRGKVHGLNSGYAAMNLAFLAGATEIRLLGFDFNFKAGGSHFYGDYPWHRQSNDRQIRKWAVQFERAAAQMQQHGVQVLNFVGPQGSSVESFPTVPLEEIAA